ncbi:MAG: DMT family transporter [Dehalococcoidia bacterium]|nr:DMT family transporter [Dehalococcoidia bacterium]
MGEGMALVAAFLWAITSTLLRALGQAASPLWIGVVRLWVAALFIVAVAAVRGDIGALWHLSPGEAAAIAGSGVLAYAAGDTLYIRALARFGLATVFPASMSAFIGLTVVGGIALLGEPFSVGLALGGAGIVAGVWLLAEGGRRSTVSGASTGISRGEMLATVAAIAVLWASATLLLTWGQAGLPALAVGSLRTPAAALAVSTVALVADARAARLLAERRRLAAGAAAAGRGGAGIGSLLYVVALHEAGAARTAVLSSTSPVWGLPLAVTLLGERPTLRTVAGTALALGGAMAVVLL